MPRKAAAPKKPAPKKAVGEKKPAKRLGKAQNQETKSEPVQVESKNETEEPSPWDGGKIAKVSIVHCKS